MPDEPLKAASWRYLHLRSEYARRLNPEATHDPEVLAIQRQMSDLCDSIARDHLPLGSPPSAVRSALGEPDIKVADLTYYYMGREPGRYWGFFFDESGCLEGFGECVMAR